MGWLVALLCIVLLGFLPVGIYASYDSGGAVAFLRVGPVRVALYPKRKSASKKHKSAAEGSFKKGAGESKNLQQKKPFGTLSDFCSVAQLILEFLSDLRRKLRVRNLELKLLLAAEDPCDLSINYGRAWAALGNLMPQLERLFVIKKRNLEIACDYTAEQTLVEARIDIVITVGRLLGIVAYHGFRGLRKYNEIIKRIKGGATS